MDQLLDCVFAVVCGQNPEHTWMPGGMPMPCCQRCSGLYIGAVVALSCHVIWRPGLSSRFLAIHALFLAIAAPFGFDVLPQGPLVRTLTGMLCGFGVATFLWLIPADHWFRRSGPPPAKTTWYYSLGLVAVLILLPLAESCGTQTVRWGLNAMAVAGLLSLAALVLGIIGLGWIVLLRRRFANGTERQGVRDDS